jgi:Reverse transcriptase (RNA-dependent DNA polymerase)
MLILSHFYSNSLRVAKLNHVMLCIISKDTDAQVIQKFRPIRSVDCSYKIIFKILTNRLSKFMNKLVDPTQAAFIHHKYILDNVLATNKIINYTKFINKKGLF